MVFGRFGGWVWGEPLLWTPSPVHVSDVTWPKRSGRGWGGGGGRVQLPPHLSVSLEACLHKKQRKHYQKQMCEFGRTNLCGEGEGEGGGGG